MRKNILNKFILFVATFIGCANYAVSQEYFQRIASEGVEMYGLITFSPINQIDDMVPGLYKFGFDDKFKPNDNGVLFQKYIAGGGVYHNGKIYCNVYSNEANLPMQKPVWTILDAETYEVLYEKELQDNCQCTTTSLAYDITNNKIYGIVVDFTDSYLVEVDPETGDMHKVGGAMDRNLRFKTLVSASNGMLYSTVIDTKDQGLHLYKIRKTDGLAVKVKSITGKNLLGPDDYLANQGTEQSLFINRGTNKVYWIFESSSMKLDGNYTPIFELNLANAEATLVSYLSRSYQISGAWLKEPLAGAPGVVSDFEFVAETGSVNGHFECNIPEKDYFGKDFITPSSLQIRITEGEDVLVEENVEPGSKFVSEEMNLVNDNHNVAITLINDKGNGPTIYRTFRAGYDLPSAPTNIRLTYDGLTTTLTWDAPTTGINGAPIDPENITYKVVRYPYEITVSEGQKERVYTETHPADMTRYVYTVFSMYGGKEGGWGYSNNLIIGTPLNPPYGGLFRDPADMLNYYTLLDSNGDGHCWQYDFNTFSAVYIFNEKLAADDWMIAPPINYKKGEKYTLKFKAYSSQDNYRESLEVKFGKGRTPEEQTKLLIDIPQVPGVSEDNPVQEYSTPITVDEDGIYYFGFHAKSAKFREFLYVFDIKLELASGIEQNVKSAIVVETENGTLKIQNPDGERISVFGSNGMLVDSFADCDYERSLHSGLYIIKTDKSVTKVIIK